jgi:ABC-2 type transport system ATP-binding protein
LQAEIVAEGDLRPRTILAIMGHSLGILEQRWSSRAQASAISIRLLTPMPVIEIENLVKSYRVYQKREGLAASIKGLFRREYREVNAVRGIDLTVDQGEFVAFLGPNGAGKTTTLKLLSGVINPTAGVCRVMGHIPWRRENAYRRRFALVMGQKNQLWWDLPAQESFRLHQHIYRIDPKAFQRTLDELTDLLDIGRLLSQPVRELSLGERMKMELTAALLHSPEVLFLDEPTIGLDVVAQHNIQQFLNYYQEKRRITILLTSHYMKDVAALCKRVVIITQGQIKYDGSLSGILDRFSGSKIVTLQLPENEKVDHPEQLGEVLKIEPPKIKLRVPRQQVPSLLSRFLDHHVVEDIMVEDPPLEEVIASLFAETSGDSTSNPAPSYPRSEST